MFDVSFWELLVVAIIALLVIGPEKLPSVAAEAGKWFGRAQRFIRNARIEIEREFHNYEIKQALEKQKENIEDIKNIAAKAGNEFKNEMKSLVDDQKQINKKSINSADKTTKDAEE